MADLYQLKRTSINSVKHLLLVVLFCMIAVVGMGSAEEKVSQIDSLKQQLSFPLPDSTRIEVLDRLSTLLYRQNLQSALVYAKEALELAEHTPYFRKVELYAMMGNIYCRIPDYPKALTYYFLGFKLAETAGNPRQQMYMLNNIGVCYIDLKQDVLAEKYLKQSLKLALEDKAKELNPHMIYINLGVVAYNRKHFHESIDWNQKALEVETKQPKKLGGIYNNIGNAYTKLNRRDMAETYYMKALQTADTADAYVLIDIYTSLGEMYTQTKQYNKAAHYLFMAKEKSEQSGINKESPALYEHIATLYEKQGDFKNAYVYTRLMQVLRDSVYKETYTRQINEMQVMFDTEKKDQQIKLLNQKKEVAEVQVKRQEWFRNSLIIVVVLVLVACFSLYRNVKQKQQTNFLLSLKNEQIEAQRLQIEAQNNELNSFNKELIKENVVARYEVLKSKVNPHFLFNALTTLSSLVVKDRHAALEFTDQFAKLYRMILETGDRKYINLFTEMKIVSHYLYLEKIRFGDNLIVDTNIDKSYYQTYVPPFSVQMVVENAIKHNKILEKEKLKIDIYTEDDCIVIKNNLQDATVAYNSTLTGQKNIIERYKLSSNLQPSFTKTLTEYEVKLPLIKEETDVV